LARTLANSPEILLLDEPTSALDDEAKQEIEKLVTAIIREQGITCLMVTHDKQQAMRMASHAMNLEKGKLIGSGIVGEFSMLNLWSRINYLYELDKPFCRSLCSTGGSVGALARDPT
jgi:ABC-type methionine transport system ATPase subunit